VRRGEELASVEEIFDLDDLPGFLEQPDFLRLEASAEVNYRVPQGNPRRGGLYRLTLERFEDQKAGLNTFRRVELDVQQYLPLVKDRRVVALRGFLSSAEGAGERRVPFYMQRTLGGPDDLRGFRRFRFRDENLLLLQAEYRWEIFTAVDGAIFYDAGMVAPQFDQLTLERLETDYGIGFRFGTVKGVFLRIEGAFGSSGGRHFILTFDHVF
jgi:outer membrane protein assembly factor BamA